MTCPRPWLLALLLGCSFDASGLGATPSTLSGADGHSSTTTTSTTGGPPLTTSGTPGTTSTDGVSGSESGQPTTSGTTSIGTTTSVGTTTDPGTTTEIGEETTTSTTAPMTTTTGEPGTTTSTTSTTGPQPCQGPVKLIELVVDAAPSGPMQVVMSNQGEGIVAYSQTEQQGTITFTVEIMCPGQYSVWGRVLDSEPGVNNYDPDSFYVHLDNDPEIGWYYGCQTGNLNDGYHWLPIRSGFEGQSCDTAIDWPLNLAAGVHTITLRNREGIDGQGYVAAVARILLTNNPGYLPMPPD